MIIKNPSISQGIFLNLNLSKLKFMETKIGTKFGLLTTTSLPYRKLATKTTKNPVTYVDVVCSCGIEKSVKLYHLRTQATVSCGCISAIKAGIRFRTHGLSKHPLYNIFNGMRSRCYNNHNKSFKYYGGRGITICDEWRNDFRKFYDWALDNGWEQGLEIDRFPNNESGIYEPSNCRFTTPIEQNINKRNIILSLSKALAIRTLFKCGTHTKIELAEIFNVCVSSIEYTIQDKRWV